MIFFFVTSSTNTTWLYLEFHLLNQSVCILFATSCKFEPLFTILYPIQVNCVYQVRNPHLLEFQIISSFHHSLWNRCSCMMVGSTWTNCFQCVVISLKCHTSEVSTSFLLLGNSHCLNAVTEDLRPRNYEQLYFGVWSFLVLCFSWAF